MGAAVVIAAATIFLLGHGGTGTAAGATSTPPPLAGDFFEPQLGLPATEVVAFGSAPDEAGGGVTWAYGVLGQTPAYVDGKAYSDQYALLKRSDVAPHAWQVVPLPEGSDGKPLAPAGEAGSGPAAYGALAGQATEAGGFMLLSGKHLIVGDPGGDPALAAEPEQSAAGEGDEHGLASGESLLPTVSGKSTVPYAAVEEEEGGSKSTGVLIAPYHDGGKPGPSGEPESPPGVLRYSGHEWTREPIEAEAEQLDHFTALAISCSGTQAAPGASSPEDCWLLAGYGTRSGDPEHLALFRRARSSNTAGWSWKAQPVTDWLLGHAALPAGVTEASVSPLPQGAQMLTATAQGVWVDFEARIDGATPVDASELVLLPAETGEAATVAGAWCYPIAKGCQQSLGAKLPTSYRSFAWPGTPEADLGTRVITGLPDRTLLELVGGAFEEEVGPGGEPGAGGGGAAFYLSSSHAVEGVIADGLLKDHEGPDGEGQSQAIGVTPSEGDQAHEEDASPVDQLHEEAVPFRHPLLAVAQAPGSAPGDPNAEALAVGLHGEVGRYVPSEGWQPEGLYNAEGRAVPAQLRAVAWPEPHRAYAVGDEGQMWMWMKETGYWVPDPAKPFNFYGNLTAIAFDASNPQLGFAVGKEGALLKYGKSWEEITKQVVKKEARRIEGELKAEEWRLNFTSVAFAGAEAVATYRLVAEEAGGQSERGGLLVYNEGQACVVEDEELERALGKKLPPGERPCWHADSSAAAVLSGLPFADTVLSKVAGLPDGGAVAAGPDLVIERESAGAGWHLSPAPLPEAQNISALAAYREGGSGPVRAIASIELDRMLNPDGVGDLERGPYGGDVPVATGPGQPPPYIPADPLPNSGYVVKETADGWTDIEHEALPVRTGQGDMPRRPTPVFALLVSPSGGQGLAVGGQTYDAAGHGVEEKGETAGALRFPAAGNQNTTGVLPKPFGDASFIVGGDASCAESCWDLANEGIGPDVWLTHALQTASRIEGARGFLYVGNRTVEDSTRELTRFEDLLGAAGTHLPVFVDPSTFRGAIPTNPQSHGPSPVSCTKAAVACETGVNAYSLTSTASSTSGGSVKLIVLEYSSSGELGAKQLAWLQYELCAAKQEENPAIVMGREALGFSLPIGSGPSQAQAAEAVSELLVRSKCGTSGYASASAYVFNYPAVNVKAQVSFKGKSINAYGTGTLGPQTANTGTGTDTLQSSAFLELNIDVAARNPVDNEAPVEAVAVPNAGALAINATNGALLRRSHEALFEGLARRPPAGVAIGGSNANEGRLVYPSSYDPIPTNCQGENCPYEIPLEFTFTSSNPDVGGFVVHEASSANASEVQLNSKGTPIPDEPRNTSGELNPDLYFDRNIKGELVNENEEPVPTTRSALFCAYNEGTTIVSITAGGLTYSMPVTVQNGSAERPCGTVPLKHPPPLIEPSTTPFVVPNTTPSGVAPVNPQISNLVPPPVPAKAPLLRHARQSPPQLPAAPATLLALPPALLSPSPNLPRPIPPSGTAQVPSQSPVAQQVSIAEREEEVEGAYQHVHNMASYRHSEGESMPLWPVALIVIAAAAGAGMRPRRRRDAPAYAWARERRER